MRLSIHVAAVCPWAETDSAGAARGMVSVVDCVVNFKE